MKSPNLRKIIVLMIVITILSSFIGTSDVLAMDTTYYVDSANGNDNNTGTSPYSAWQSLTKINNTIFQPGDKILFKADCSWNGQLYPKGSGVVGNPIIIDMYGTGSNKPLINGQGAVMETLKFYNQQYWEVNNLSITNLGATRALRRAVFIEACDMGVCNHIYLKNLDIHDVNSLVDEFTEEQFETGGIVVLTTGSTTSTIFNDLLIDGCTFKTVDKVGIFIRSIWRNRAVRTDGAGPWAGFTNVVVRNNFLDDIGADGIITCECESPLVEYNVAKDCNQRSSISGCGIWPINCDDAVFQYNEVYNMKWTGSDSNAYDIDWNNDNVTYQYNYSHNNGGGFMLVCCMTTGSFNTNGIIRYNISQNDLTSVFRIAGPCNNTNIYNNTFYIGSGLSTDVYRMEDWGGYPSNTYSYNNIYYNLGSGGYDWGNSTNNVFDYNLFYGNHPVSEPQDAHKSTSDPQLMSPGNAGVGFLSVWGYKLTSNSPCINTGKTIANNGGKDFWGNTVPYGTTAPDRGAYEYQGVQESSPTPLPFGVIPQSEMTAAATSQKIGNEARKAVDHNPNTIWHMDYDNNGTPLPSLPASITINLGAAYSVDRLIYLPRQDGGTNGNITGYNIYVSTDGSNFTQVVSNGIWSDNQNEKSAAFPAVAAAYVKLEVTGGHGGYASAAEINVETKTIPQAQMTAAATSQQGGYEACHAIDHNTTTMWANQWNPPTSLPQSIILDLGSTYTINRLRYLPRQDEGTGNGVITQYNIYTSTNGTDWIKVVDNGTWNDDRTEKSATFSPIGASFVKLEVTAGHGGYATASEIYIDCGFETILTTQVPTSPANDQQYELGTKFKPTVDGSITKVRLYTHALEGGSHTVRIWRVSDSTCLSGPHIWNITSGTAGWKEYTLPAALNVSADTDYIVSISNSSSDKYYMGTSALFPINSGHLQTYSNSGVYTTSLGTMPTNTLYNCYFRDVVFIPAYESIFTTQTPSYYCNDLQYELGTKFKATIAGNITKVRLYTNASEGGNHTVRIWRVSDNACLSGPYTWNIKSGTAGWKEFMLPSAVRIAADTDYIVSISNSTDKYYARHDTLFPVNNDSLVTYSTSGVYTTTLGTMPTSTNGGGCTYFRDVVFVP